MDDFKNAGLGTFEEELQALVDYGHDCCARIDDKIHECCERIKKAHDVEVGGYAIALGWKEQQDEWATTYDVLGNERHKAVCELKRLRFIDEGTDFSGAVPPKIRIGDVCNLIGAFSKLQDDWPSTLATARDTLIYLLGGDNDGMDAAGRGVCDCASADVPAAGRPDDSGDRTDNQWQVLAPVTQELRNYLEAYRRPVETDTCMEVARIGTLGYQGIMERLDAIDAIHANLEREVKRLAAECKTQRNNFDQATSAREHWKNLYEQALEHTHDLERDYEVACHVNERQEREYLEWYNRACRMQKEIDDLKAKSGDMWLKGYHECHEELMEGNATLAADLEKAGWMMLPKDSDGVPVRIGDMMEWPDTTTAEVVGVGDGTFFYVEVGETVAHWTRTHDKIHHQPESVEDTLREFARAWTEWQDGAPIMNPVESFATKLRLADDAE